MARHSNLSDPLFDEAQSSNKWARYAMGAAILVVVGFIGYAALSTRDAPQGPVPVIRADETPWTRAPSEVGGMEIPNQDSMVFDLMDKTADKQEDNSVDKIVEETMNKPVDKSADKPEDKSVDKLEDKPVDAPMPPSEADLIGSLIEDNAGDKAAEKPVEITAEKPIEKPVEKTSDKSVEKPVDIAVEKPSTAAPLPIVRVRLGSVPGNDTGLAADEFARLKAISEGGLNSAAPSYDSVDLGSKGKFVRINASLDKAAAEKLCDTLSSKGAPCLILGE